MRSWLSSMQHQSATSDGEMGSSNVRLTQYKPRPLWCLDFSFVSTIYCVVSVNVFVTPAASLGPLRIVP
jgi:hypothetical protein